MNPPTPPPAQSATQRPARTAAPPCRRRAQPLLQFQQFRIVQRVDVRVRKFRILGRARQPIPRQLGQGAILGNDHLGGTDTQTVRLDQSGRDIDLEVDGGIDPDTARRAVEAGADALVAGTATFRGGPDAYAANIAALRG